MNFMGGWLSFFTYQMLRMAVVVFTHPLAAAATNLCLWFLH